MELLRLQQKITKTLENNSFKIINNTSSKEKFVMISNFGDELPQSTFYINKKNNMDDLVIGAHITLDNKILTKFLLGKIHLISSKHNVSCSSVKYDIKNDTGTMSLQIIYNFDKYNDKIFMLYVNKFKDCIKALYDNIYKHLQHKETIYLDLSMFDGADWTIFDPYMYIIERDKKYNGSWGQYILYLKNNLDKKDNIAELIYVEMCKKFEDSNNTSIDLACDYIIENIMQHIDKNNNAEKILN